MKSLLSLSLCLLAISALGACTYDTSHYANHGRSYKGEWNGRPRPVTRPQNLDELAPPPVPTGHHAPEANNEVPLDRQTPPMMAPDDPASRDPMGDATEAEVTATTPPANMAVYTNTKRNYSLYYPSGWHVQSGVGIVSLFQNKNNKSAPQMHILTMNYPRTISRKQGVNVLTAYLKQLSRRYGVAFSLRHRFTITGTSGCRALAFSMKKNPYNFEGFAVVTVSGKRVIYAIVFGQKGHFNFNAPLTLGYILQSFAAGSRPKTPSIAVNELLLTPSTSRDAHMGIIGFVKTITGSLSL